MNTNIVLEPIEKFSITHQHFAFVVNEKDQHDLELQHQLQQMIHGLQNPLIFTFCSFNNKPCSPSQAVLPLHSTTPATFRIFPCGIF